MAAPEKKPVVHRVLYIQREANLDFHPLASREVGDPNADEDFAAIRLEHVTHARRAGAVRPVFRVDTECGGQNVPEKN